MKPLNRTTKLLTAYCYLNTTITEMVVRAVIEMKNSKNIYSVWLDQTLDYCKEFGEDHVDGLGLIADVFYKLDRNLVPPCPIKVFKMIHYFYFTNIYF